jgi:hypothetical protein
MAAAGRPRDRHLLDATLVPRGSSARTVSAWHAQTKTAERSSLLPRFGHEPERRLSRPKASHMVPYGHNTPATF